MRMRLMEVTVFMAGAVFAACAPAAQPDIAEQPFSSSSPACVTEGEALTYGACCEGLTPIPASKFPICMPCGDSQCEGVENRQNCPQDCPCGDALCKAPETKQNCPLDCTKVGEEIRLMMYIDKGSLDAQSGVFTGKIWPSREGVRVIPSASTRYYAFIDGNREYVDRERFPGIFRGFEQYMGILQVVGVLRDANVIDASEVWWGVQ